MSVNDITRENIDFYLKELSKEYRKHNGRNAHVELVLVGGASIVLNYGFRSMTTDIDGIVGTSSVKDSINVVGDRYGLPRGWLNEDFKKTDSYSPRIIEFSDYYRTFSNVMEIRTVKSEYLVAMKLVSGRQYKKDLSDIVGILDEQSKSGHPIDFDKIDVAMRNLYGGWDKVDSFAKNFLSEALVSDDLSSLFKRIVGEELFAKQVLLKAEETRTVKVDERNVDFIIEQAKAERDKLTLPMSKARGFLVQRP